MAAATSKEAQAYLIDPMNAPEPSAETGPGAHFGSTFDPKQPSTTTTTTPPRTSLGSKNPFRDNASPTGQTSKPEAFPDYRRDAFGDHNTAPPPPYDASHSSPSNTTRPRRTSSLRERFPGDESHKPLEILRRDSKKAYRSPHLNKRHLPGPDVIDRLDPALGGRAYHHEGPYDAAALARNTDLENSPVAALQSSNAEALKATPAENIRDALERHRPLDGVAVVPPGQVDKFGRVYNYEEGTDLMREGGGMDGPGYKRWPGEVYDPNDLKGQSEPTYSLDRALQAHNINGDGIEMEDRADRMRDYQQAERKGKLDTRDPVDIAGDDGKYAEMEFAAMGKDHDVNTSVRRTGSLRAAGESLKKRIGSLRRRKDHDE